MLRPGERIDQEAVGEALDVSRSPIREAVVVLEGLLTLSRNRGAFVADITPADITEHDELFGAVSGRAAALAAEQLTDGEIDGLASIHRRFEHGSHAEMSVVNHDFHRLINRGAPRRTRWPLALRERSVPADYDEFSAGVYADAVDDHAAILTAITDRDPDGARRAMEHHLRQDGAAAATEALRRQGFWKDEG